MPSFDIQSLQSCFEVEQVQTTFGSLYHSLGFITAVASAPEKIPAQEWMPQLVNPNCPDISIEADDLVEKLNLGFVNWWKSCDAAFEHSQKLALPEGLGIEDNGLPSQDLIEFSMGYLDAYSWLSGSWEQLMPKDSPEAVRSLTVLNVILARFIDEEKTAKSEPTLFNQLPNIQECLKTLPTLISAVGMLGKDIVQSNEAPNDELNSSSEPSLLTPIKNEMRSVGRNDNCPCGSGKKFKKCCLH